MKSRLTIVNLSENVVYPLLDRRCVGCGQLFGILAFSRQRVCGACV